ncbi:MAG: bifunctional ADP-dependent NAD(P)H-hydrate dehydratase/NAD(P)H-hydrate epimerase [Betaproteobacteria bacterium HGW-Betaproteobacteria-10]|nr:MAG: bifunctional ADP-dependent NAD(P)H-hydrate dehydratase/NAD(P)H-hydrate epimerase [Betaproteobacteria bacterium HGW-Betaproteobacteria-10]
MPQTALYLSATLRQIETRHADEPLMQGAGAAAAAWAMELAGERSQPILILAGPGNNGGDAFEAARLLRQHFFDVRVVFSGKASQLPRDAEAAYQRFSAAGGATLENIPVDTGWSLIIDGLFGIGLRRAPEGLYADWIVSANQLAKDGPCPLLALDCPSGLNTDTGQTLGQAIFASHTLTFIAAKPGLLTADGPDHCGEIRVAKLDLTPEANHPADGRQVSLSDFFGYLKPRQRNTHKGSFGTAGILGGAPSMVGAAFLAGRAALKLGAGKVYVGLLEQPAPTLDLLQPELMLRRPRTLLQTPLNALAVGPGLGVSLEASELLENAISLDQALVLDADGLNLVAREGNLQVALASRSQPAILTPHPSEAARLLDCSTAEVQADRIAAAREIAAHYRCHVALKGCGTVIAAVDGKFWINSTGNPGMATAGMGDVLSGLIVALLAQGWPSINALLAGVHLHGAAADRLVANGIGPIGLTAGEVIDIARDLFNEWVATGKSAKCS